MLCATLSVVDPERCWAHCFANTRECFRCGAPRYTTPRPARAHRAAKPPAYGQLDGAGRSGGGAIGKRGGTGAPRALKGATPAGAPQAAVADPGAALGLRLRELNACGRDWRRALGILAGMRRDALATAAPASASPASPASPFSPAVSPASSASSVACAVVPAHAFAAAISACGKGGEWTKALELLEGMVAAQRQFAGGPPGAAGATPEATPGATLGAMLGAAPGKDVPSAEVAPPLPREVPRPDVVCVNAAIGACGRSGRWEEALALLRCCEEGYFGPQVNGGHTHWRSKRVEKPALARENARAETRY